MSQTTTATDTNTRRTINQRWHIMHQVSCRMTVCQTNTHVTDVKWYQYHTTSLYKYRHSHRPIAKPDTSIGLMLVSLTDTLQWSPPHQQDGEVCGEIVRGASVWQPAHRGPNSRSCTALWHCQLSTVHTWKHNIKPALH